MLRGRLFSDICRFGIIFEINTVIILRLVTADVGFSIQVIRIIFMDIEMVRLDLSDNRDGRGFFEIPELETGHFVNYDGILSKAVENIEGGRADVADKINIFAFGV